MRPSGDGGSVPMKRFHGGRGTAREIPQRRAVQAFLAAEVVIHRGDVHVRRLDDLSDACAREAVTGELLGRGRQQTATRLVLQLVFFGEHAPLPFLNNCFKLLFELRILLFLHGLVKDSYSGTSISPTEAKITCFPRCIRYLGRFLATSPYPSPVFYPTHGTRPRTDGRR